MIDPMDFELRQLLELLGDRPDAPASLALVRGALFLGACASAIELAWILFSLRSERHLLASTFVVSLLVHLCLCSVWYAATRSADPADSARHRLQPDPDARDVRTALRSNDPPIASQSKLGREALAALPPLARQAEREIRDFTIDPIAAPPPSATVSSLPLPPTLDLPREILPPAPRTAMPLAVDAPASPAPRQPLDAAPAERNAPVRRREAHLAPPQRQQLSSAARTPAVAGPPPPPASNVQRLTPPAIPAFRSPPGLRESESSVPAQIEPGDISTRPRSAEPPLPSVVQGTVRDVATGRPLADVTIRIDRIGQSPYLAQSDATGRYELNVLELPNHSVATAAREGYVPDSRELTLGPNRKTIELDFILRPAVRDLIPVEAEPVVHHLGNDRFEGRVNSQFQRASEGVTLTLPFEIAAGQLRRNLSRAAVGFLAKGLQSNAEIRINGRLLPDPLRPSPADGSFAPITVPFDPALLKPGRNHISITTVANEADLDDFEFVNLQIRLSARTTPP